MYIYIFLEEGARGVVRHLERETNLLDQGKIENLNILFNFYAVNCTEIIFFSGLHTQTLIPTASNFRVISRNHWVEICISMCPG